MKKSFIKFFDKIILLLLGISGMFVGCKPECERFSAQNPPSSPGTIITMYGMPVAQFELLGTVKDKSTKKPIPNIRIIKQINTNIGDTLYTDSNGKYHFVSHYFPYTLPLEDNYMFPVTVLAEDIDGVENGGLYHTKKIDTEVTNKNKVSHKKCSDIFVKKIDIELESE